MSDDKNKVVKVIEHPIEEFLDIERGTTEVEVFSRESKVISAESYDIKDDEIDEQFQEVYDNAMDGYDLLSEELHKVEGRYKARVGEVSVQHLNAALNAASGKAKLKEHKDKLVNDGKKGPSSVTHHNTLIVDDRSALLDALRKQMEGKNDE